MNSVERIMQCIISFVSYYLYICNIIFIFVLLFLKTEQFLSVHKSHTQTKAKLPNSGPLLATLSLMISNYVIERVYSFPFLFFLFFFPFYCSFVLTTFVSQGLIWFCEAFLAKLLITKKLELLVVPVLESQGKIYKLFI